MPLQSTLHNFSDEASHVTSHRLILSLAGILLGGSVLAVQPPEPPAPPAAPAPPWLLSMGSGDGLPALVDSSEDSVTMAGTDVDGQQIKQLQRSLKGISCGSVTRARAM